MKRLQKVWSILLSAALLTCSLPFAASAKPDSGEAAIPIVDADFWEVQTGDGEDYDTLNNDEAWVTTTIAEDGSITLKRTDKAKDPWAAVRSIPVEKRPTFNLNECPYLYYDITATGDWNILLTLNGVTVRIAKPICNNGGKNLVSRWDGDGKAGTYQGKFDLREYLKSESAFSQISGLDEMFIPHVTLYVVDSSLNSFRSEFTVNQLSIGNDDESMESGPALSFSLVTGDDEPWPEDWDRVDGETLPSRTKLSTTARTTATTGGGQSAGDADGTDSNGWVLPVVIAAVAVVIVAGVVITVVILRKKKNGAPKG